MQHVAVTWTVWTDGEVRSAIVRFLNRGSRWRVTHTCVEIVATPWLILFSAKGDKVITFSRKTHLCKVINRKAACLCNKCCTIEFMVDIWTEPVSFLKRRACPIQRDLLFIEELSLMLISCTLLFYPARVFKPRQRFVFTSDSRNTGVFILLLNNVAKGFTTSN